MDNAVEFNGNRISSIICLGTGTSFDVSMYEGFSSFTIDNFFIEPVNDSAGGGAFKADNLDPTYHWVNMSISKTKSYNALNGILTAYYYCRGHVNSSQKSCVVEATKNVAVTAWLIY